MVTILDCIAPSGLYLRTHRPQAKATLSWVSLLLAAQLQGFVTHSLSSTLSQSAKLSSPPSLVCTTMYLRHGQLFIPAEANVNNAPVSSISRLYQGVVSPSSAQLASPCVKNVHMPTSADRKQTVLSPRIF